MDVDTLVYILAAAELYKIVSGWVGGVLKSITVICVRRLAGYTRDTASIVEKCPEDYTGYNEEFLNLMVERYRRGAKLFGQLRRVRCWDASYSGLTDNVLVDTLDQFENAQKLLRKYVESIHKFLEMKKSSK